ncbi:MAG: hypothetical protein ABIA47_02085, partial [bacterium]
MATEVVDGDRYGRYFDTCGILKELDRQLRQENGYPFDQDALDWALRRIAEGRFTELGWHAPAENGEDDIAAEVNRLVECMFRAGYHKATNGGKGMKG